MLRCYHCNNILPQHYVLGSDDAWNLVNVSPDAASGGVMAPIHVRCQHVNVYPFPPKDLSKSNSR